MTTYTSITDLINAGMADPKTPQGYMGSLFDNPDYRRQRAFDTLGSIGAALLKASGPSLVPMDFGSVLAQGLAGAADGQRDSEDRYLRRLMTSSQVAKNQSEMAREQEWSDLSKTPSAAAPGPTLGQPAPAAMPPVAAGNSPNPNNVGNVRPVGQSVGFQQPASLDDGIRLAVNNVKAYPAKFNNGQPMTLLQIGQRWAPKGDGANDPNQWALNVGSIGGLDPNQPLDFNDPVVAAKFARGVHGAEWGQTALKDPAVYTAALTTPPGVAQGSGGDGSGNPVQPVQYQPQAPRPQSIQDVIATMPEGVRRMVGSMPRKDGMAIVMKYADPGSSPALDTQTGQVVFVPSTVVGRDPRFQPVEGAKLQIERDKLANDQRRTDSTIMNADVIPGPDGRPMVNETVLNAKKGVSAAQGTDPGSKITVELAQDAIKRNNEWQTAGMKAQSSLNRLGALNTLLDQITTGKFAGSTAQLKATAKAAGIDLEAMGVKDDVGVAQAVTALTNLMALENRDPSGGAGMPGAMSDADRAFLQEAGPSITKDPRGNKILIAIKRGDLQRQADIAKFAREYIKSPEFKTNPAGIDDYVAEKIAGKDYYDPNTLGGQSVAPPGTIPNAPLQSFDRPAVAPGQRPPLSSFGGGR